MKARLPKGMGGGSMNDMMQKAQKMQEDMQTLQAELDERDYTASSGGGMVEVTVTGKHMLKSVKINPDVVLDDDVEMLEDLIMAAVNEAVRTADETASKEMEKVTGSMSIPGMPGFM